jgi:hypothetical protein
VVTVDSTKERDTLPLSFVVIEDSEVFCEFPLASPEVLAQAPKAMTAKAAPTADILSILFFIAFSFSGVVVLSGILADEC